MVQDWDDAYRNAAHIENGASYPARWNAAALSFRESLSGQGRIRTDIAYGPRPRQLLDLFLPAAAPHGLVVFVHGGYWMSFDKSSWSHLARGAVEAGWAIAIPSYTLAPEASVATITREITDAILHAASLIGGPIRLAGHSAGGHLVTRMVCSNAPLAAATLRRIDHVLSISGLHDLRPLQRTEMNATLFHTAGEAAAESPALLEPVPGTRLTCWVGADERPEFLRQNDLLANIWTGLGAQTRSVREPGRHHFTVIDGLAEAGSPLMQAFLLAA